MYSCDHLSPQFMASVVAWQESISESYAKQDKVPQERKRKRGQETSRAVRAARVMDIVAAPSADHRAKMVGVHPEGWGWQGKAPLRLASGELRFDDAPLFRPNLTPLEMFQRGSFGGGYMRDIYSAVTREHYTNIWEEWPAEWLAQVNISTHLASREYHIQVMIASV
jgi:hypothetical protein